MKLRDYQQEALESVISKYLSGVTKQMIVLPTGTGKTIIIAAIIKHFQEHIIKDKVLVIAHRKELISQNIEKIKLFLAKKGKPKIGILASGKIDIRKKIIVGSIQSCSRDKNLNLLKNEKIDLLIIDEAHHSHAKSYRKLIKNIDYKLLIGFTATPRKGNGNIYDEIVYSKDIQSMISDKYLCNIIGRKIKTGVELSDVNISQGDYAIGELSKKIDIESRNKIIVQKFLLHAKSRKKAIAFCATIEHASSLAKAFKTNKIKSEVLHSKLHSDIRKERLEHLKNGKVKVLTSVGILTEGFDMPDIDTIIMARPTKIKGFYIQMIGRGLRPNKNKHDCMVLDFNDEDLSLKQSITLESITGKFIEPDPRGRDPLINETCHLPENYLTLSDNELDPFSDIEYIGQQIEPESEKKKDMSETIKKLEEREARKKEDAEEKLEKLLEENARREEKALSENLIACKPLIEELKKYNLPTKNFELNLAYDWQYKYSDKEIKCSLQSDVFVSIKDDKVSGRILNQTIKKDLNHLGIENNEVAIFQLARLMEQEQLDIIKFKTTKYLKEQFKLNRKQSEQQKAFLIQLLTTKNHNLKIYHAERVSFFIASIAISFLLNRPTLKKSTQPNTEIKPISYPEKPQNETFETLKAKAETKLHIDTFKSQLIKTLKNSKHNQDLLNQIENLCNQFQL